MTRGVGKVMILVLDNFGTVPHKNAQKRFMKCVVVPRGRCETRAWGSSRQPVRVSGVPIGQKIHREVGNVMVWVLFVLDDGIVPHKNIWDRPEKKSWWS